MGGQALTLWLGRALPPLPCRVSPCVSPTLPVRERVVVVPSTRSIRACPAPVQGASPQGCSNQISAPRSPPRSQGLATIPTHHCVPEGSCKFNDVLVCSENPGAWRQEIRENRAHRGGKAGPAPHTLIQGCNPASALDEQQCLTIPKATPATEASGEEKQSNNNNKTHHTHTEHQTKEDADLLKRLQKKRKKLQYEET